MNNTVYDQAAGRYPKKTEPPEVKVEEAVKVTPRLTTTDPNYNHQIDAIIIDEDRYGGSYSGFMFTAWYCGVPDDIDAGDGTCEEFWKNNDIVFGGGSTPDQAVADLLTKILLTHRYDPDPYPKVIYNTSHYAKFDHTTVFVGCVKDSRFATVYPKSHAIFKKHWG